MTDIKKVPLQAVVEKIEQGLATRSSADRQTWADGIGEALADLEKVLVEHEKRSESPTGAMSVLNSSKQDTAPILDRKVQQFRFEHLQFLEKTRDLQSQLQALSATASADTEIEPIQKAALELVQLIRSHLEAEENLMLTTINQDTGVGD